MMDQLSLTTQRIEMIAETGTVMAIGTGFLYEWNNTLFIVTNGHNISRINPSTGIREDNSAGFPTQIRCRIKCINIDKPETIHDAIQTINLYSDSEFEKPRWYIHPQHGWAVDVVLIPLTKLSESSKLTFYPLNKQNFSDNVLPRISDDVFILGYPLSLTGDFDLPIWKRGSIATEPIIDLGNMPKMLVDTTSKPGMSGSPVIFQRSGLHTQGDKLSLTDFFGVARNFVGIYSGRVLGQQGHDSQLGIVWKASVINEIIEGDTKGNIFFQKI